MDHREFLADPIRLFAPEIPLDWFRAAFENSDFREYVTYALTRSVSKTGGFGLASDFVPYVRACLTETSAVALYGAIRDESQREELEWRADFEAVFPEHAGALPSPQASTEYTRESIFTIIDSDDCDSIEEWTEHHGVEELSSIVNAAGEVPLVYAQRAGAATCVAVIEAMLAGDY